MGAEGTSRRQPQRQEGGAHAGHGANSQPGASGVHSSPVRRGLLQPPGTHGSGWVSLSYGQFAAGRTAARNAALPSLRRAASRSTHGSGGGDAVGRWPAKCCLACSRAAAAERPLCAVVICGAARVATGGCCRYLSSASAVGGRHQVPSSSAHARRVRGVAERRAHALRVGRLRGAPLHASDSVWALGCRTPSAWLRPRRGGANEERTPTTLAHTEAAVAALPPAHSPRLYMARRWWLAANMRASIAGVRPASGGSEWRLRACR